jgi:hypothetical protein
MPGFGWPFRRSEPLHRWRLCRRNRYPETLRLPTDLLAAPRCLRLATPPRFVCVCSAQARRRSGAFGFGRPSGRVILRTADNEAVLQIAVAGGAIARLRWWSFAQPPANRVRPLRCRKPKPSHTAHAASTSMPLFLTAQSILRTARNETKAIDGLA